MPESKTSYLDRHPKAARYIVPAAVVAVIEIPSAALSIAVGEVRPLLEGGAVAALILGSVALSSTLEP